MEQDFFFAFGGAAAHDDWSIFGQGPAQILRNGGVGGGTHIEFQIAAHADAIVREEKADLLLLRSAFDGQFFLHLRLDRQRGNIALARHRIQLVVRELVAP